MPRPRRRYVRVNARDEFLHRMYYATGISAYTSFGLVAVERDTPDIPLYGVERLRGILFWWGRQFNYDLYFNDYNLRHYIHTFVDRARLEVVEDWKGIP
ncbi:MAG: hypothetical protein QXP58_07055 [Thermoprotei archaeon]